MPDSTLLTIFYTLGSVFFIIAIAVVIGTAIGIWLAYRKAIELRNTALTKIAMQRTAYGSISKVAPVILSGLVTAFLKHRRK